MDFFTNINGTYAVSITVSDLRLQGQANLFSPFVNSARARFQLLPQNLGTIRATAGSSASVPSQVLTGVEQVLTHNLSAPVDEEFYQDYQYFSLPHLSLSPRL